MKGQQSYISAFVPYPAIPSSRSTRPDMTTIFHARPYDGFIEIKSNLRRKKFSNQGSNFLGGGLSNSGNVRAQT